MYFLLTGTPVVLSIAVNVMKFISKSFEKKHKVFKSYKFLLFNRLGYIFAYSAQMSSAFLFTCAQKVSIYSRSYYCLHFFKQESE